MFANKLFDALSDAEKRKFDVEIIIRRAFEKHEPEIGKKLSYHWDCDDYDKSITIYFDVSLPYPYEPSYEVRKDIYNLGFSIVYWVFTKDTMDVEFKFDKRPGEGYRVILFGEQYAEDDTPPLIMKNVPDEIRGWEPRHIAAELKWINHPKYGYVDHRFNGWEWEKKYFFHLQEEIPTKFYGI